MAVGSGERNGPVDKPLFMLLDPRISDMFVGTDKENKELDDGGCEKDADVMDVVFPLSGIGAVSVNDVATEGSVVGVVSGWDVCRRVPSRSLPLDGDDSELNRADKFGGLDVGVAR